MKKIVHFLTFCFFLGACYVLRLPDQNRAVQPANLIPGDESSGHTSGQLGTDEPGPLHEAVPAERSGAARPNRTRLLNPPEDYRETGRFFSNY
ncbi:MAG: hypothetical protein ABS46_01465 [Cytophagaceae bacterium SCN 52-12]|mgnify:CR=1 FL=1|nr:MAG: hypothetical protein ABS46_01465 [Cytophagaceae bacterium SCN 52-12]